MSLLKNQPALLAQKSIQAVKTSAKLTNELACLMDLSNNRVTIPPLLIKTLKKYMQTLQDFMDEIK